MIPVFPDAKVALKGKKGLVVGKPTAPVEMQMFIDVQCPICKFYEINYLPTVVQKSSSRTNERGLCRRTTSVCLQCAAISGAPPAPGRRTFGWPYSPITVEFRFPYRSIWAAPRNARSMRPPWIQ